MERRYAICYSVNIPLRSSPADGAEMMTELLFGDACIVLEETGTWSRIINKSDGYEGWLTTKMLTFVSKEEYDSYNPLEAPVVTSSFAVAYVDGGDERIILTGGSVLPFYDSSDSSFSVEGRRFIIDKSFVNNPGVNVVDTAYRYLNSPYLWGGKNVMGIDCSGLTQVVYRMHGFQLQRDARAQIIHGMEVQFTDAVSGDLAFFANPQGRITHVGIIAGKGKIIHASGSVHVDQIDERGIYSVRLGKYTHSLHSVRHIDLE